MVNDVYVKTLQKGKDGATWYVGTLKEDQSKEDGYDHTTAYTYPRQHPLDENADLITPIKGDLMLEVNLDKFMVWNGTKWIWLRSAESEYVHIFVEDTEHDTTEHYRGTIRSIDGAPYYVYEQVIDPEPEEEANEESEQEGE